MLCSSHSKDIVDNERAAIVPCQVFWADASGSGQWNQFGPYQPTNQPANQPTSPSTQASGQVCPYTTPYPLFQNILLNMEMLLSSELSFWLVIPSLGWRWSRGARGRVFCVVCWPPRPVGHQYLLSHQLECCHQQQWCDCYHQPWCDCHLPPAHLLQSLVVCYLPQQFCECSWKQFVFWTAAKFNHCCLVRGTFTINVLLMWTVQSFTRNATKIVQKRRTSESEKKAEGVFPWQLCLEPLLND